VNPVRPRALAPAFAGLALIGWACGRVALDQPLGGDDGQGGATSIGGHSGAGPGGSSGAGGNKGTGGAAGVGGGTGTGGAMGIGGTIGVGGATATVPCNKLSDDVTCIAHGCRADYCPNCRASRFVRCAAPGDPMPACGPAPPCFPLGCLTNNSLAACEAAGNCHGVFAPLPSGMCADSTACSSFAGCADGLFTPCASTLEPRCGQAPPSCAPGYLPSLSGPCYEGCVPQDECALPIPP
jgi:hypothetical protein